MNHAGINLSCRPPTMSGHLARVRFLLRPQILTRGSALPMQRAISLVHAYGAPHYPDQGTGSSVPCLVSKDAHSGFIKEVGRSRRRRLMMLRGVFTLVRCSLV
jgi:hypothetical protein